VEGTQPATTTALLRAAEVGHSTAAVTSGPRLVRRRSAIATVAVLIPLALLIGASAAELRARVSSSTARRFAATSATTPAPVPTRDLGTCASDYENVFATLAPLPGDVAAQVVSHLSREYAAAFDSFAMALPPDAVPPPPDAPTLAHVLARLDAAVRRAVLSALSPEQQTLVNRELLDTALLFMTYGVRPPCP
jgi:hypothetical protein